ncbi:MAG: folylpolyglutamate synthase/dihydrofolate synthase family protein [Nibricoccus sp.]
MPTLALNDYPAVQDYLFSLKAKGVKYGIDRMHSWVGALGHPERATPVIHVAGTNGKGSVSAMLEAIFSEAGWRTGLYTSPHLVRLGERVQVGRRILSEEEIIAYTNDLRPLAESVSRENPDDHPSFFEFMTAMAFLQFARQKCDVAMIEVGMGGRLDATNVVDPEIAVITSIGLDHTEFLGDTIEKIAAEKAGIIKHGRPVVIGVLPEAADRVIRAIAAEKHAPLYSVREALGDFSEAYPKTNLEGDYQRVNAATAALVARLLQTKWRFTEASVARALMKVRWPGRWQRMTLGGRELILDASHNPEGAGTLETNLARLVEETKQALVIVTGVLGAARAKPLLETIGRHAKEIHLVIPQQARACSFEELEALIPKTFSGAVRRTTVQELFPGPEQPCRAGGANDTVVVTGSIYLLGEVLARIEPQRGEIEGRLQDF